MSVAKSRRQGEILIEQPVQLLSATDARPPDALPPWHASPGPRPSALTHS